VRSRFPHCSGDPVMARNPPRAWSLLTPVLLLASACSDARETPAEPAQAAPASQSAVPATSDKATDYPAPIQALEAQRLEVLGTSSAPSGLTGYAGIAASNPVTVYVTSDGSHALIGTLIATPGQ